VRGTVVDNQRRAQKTSSIPFVLQERKESVSQLMFADKSISAGSKERSVFRFYAETNEECVRTYLAQPSDNLIAIHLRHFVVYEKDIKTVHSYQVKGVRPAFAGTDKVPLKLKQHTETVSRCSVVVYNKDSGMTHLNLRNGAMHDLLSMMIFTSDPQA
jgi:hypothetical protein